MNLSRRIIPTTTQCPLCQENDETVSHIFHHCPFARAIWLGSNLTIRTSELSLHHGLSCLTEENMDLLQSGLHYHMDHMASSKSGYP